jgi:hypothetical protein
MRTRGDISIWPAPSTWRYAPERDALSDPLPHPTPISRRVSVPGPSPRDYHQLGVHEIGGGTHATKPRTTLLTTP